MTMRTLHDHPALHGLPAIWLRDNCPCGECRDSRSGQRLLSITGLPAEVAVDAVTVSGDAVEIVFSPDGHRSVFDVGWLAQFGALRATHASAAPDDRTEVTKWLWTAAGIAGDLPEGSWPRYLGDCAHREECLRALLVDGFVLLRDVPCEPGTVLAVAGTMGFVRETNYGRLFDVRVEATPDNLAFTGLAIGPHTDNPYRDPVPTVQLLHCLASAVQGGDSGLVDGFLAAKLLRAEDPAAFDLLAGTPVTFAYADATAALQATRPMIGVDPLGRIREIRFNDRSLQPVRLPAGEITAFYAAYRAFAEMISRPELMLTFRLSPGDCVIFDNTRVLHARTGFAATGRRHLQGCYADLDGVASTWAVLRRESSDYRNHDGGQGYERLTS
jgi:gamma-butyrobetaine dioxygenase